MSILNAKADQFVIWLPNGFFYKEVVERWFPIVERLKLPYDKLEDFMNACIQGITFPSITLPHVEQQESQFKIAWRGGKELEPILEKTFNIVFKLSEGFISYWTLFEQIEHFLFYEQTMPFWPPMNISFLNHQGFEMMGFEFDQITPVSLSQFEVGYNKSLADFSTFTLQLRYNRFNIKRRSGNGNNKI